MHQPLLQLDHVSKRYGALQVTNDLSFTLAEGEALGVLGPNGAGKSTMFNLITGDVRPDQGHVLHRHHQQSHTESEHGQGREDTGPVRTVHVDLGEQQQ